MSRIPLIAANRRKLLAKILVFAGLAAVIWLQPQIQPWLDGPAPGGSDSSTDVAKHDTDPSDIKPRSSNRRRVVIKDVAEPPAAEVDRPEASTAIRTTSTSEPVLGTLREIRRNIFESTAGLHYVPGSADNHRLRHVLQHAKDDLTKPIHGVFEGNREQILAVIDEAYQKAKKADSDVRSEKQNDRSIYTVNLRRRIGYMGGSEGARNSNPECRYVRLVLENQNIVVTAYPVKSF